MQRARQRVVEAAEQGARLICLPELFCSIYFCQQEDTRYFELAEPIPGYTTDFFSRLAKTANSVLVVPVFERSETGIYYNSLVVINRDGAIAGMYRKMHIPNDPQFQEKYYFTPGDLGFQAIQTPFGKIGPMICWDQWFPEAARLCALDGANVLIYPTAIGWLPGEKEGESKVYLDSWKTVQRGHAIANGVYTATVNRVGVEPDQSGNSEIEFWGHSFIADPRGRIISEASGEEEEIIYGRIEPELIFATRQTWPFFRDRRVDAYHKIVE
ncbi:N-carbamoylputrescine amidase [Candidatus Scalindua japonica]|uniref:N-carbamoylputrescine amidase n=2 Tax=Candidatus Scalindua japonica TaxID=1284222 RepID=A0A286U217_9BACT|nr:N-carbamoylputrescine amidase [Candidatus Scalindua japonica]